MNSVAHCGGFYLRDIVEEKCRLRPALVGNFRAQQRKTRNYAPLRNFWPNREKMQLRPLLVGNLSAPNREKHDYAPLVGNSAQHREKMITRHFCNVGYTNKRCLTAEAMFRLLWTFVDLKLPSAMSYAYS